MYRNALTAMLTTILNFAQCVAEISLLGGIEIASVALIVYYVFAKTRAPAIIAGLFPNLKLNYRSSLGKFNTIGSDFLITLRASNEPKPQNAVDHGVGTQNMLQLTPHSGFKPFKRMLNWDSLFPYVAQVVRSEKFDYRQVTEIVHNDVILKHAIKQAAEHTLREQRYATNGHRLLARSISGDQDEGECEEDAKAGISYQKILRKQEQRAISILKEMGSTLNNTLLAITSWLLYKLLPCFLSGVVTNTKQIEMLKNVSKRAPDTPLIFVPLHRSHLDYIMVTFILTNNDIRSPLVAAGNNLQIPVFGSLLRGLGAFFIKRKIDPVEGKKDVLYRAALHLYLTHALKQGHNVEFFIEGGRTRTGKPCMPKGGILSVIVNAFMDGSIPDALLVPVSVNYERLVDGNFVREQKGEKKVPETFKKAISGIWKALNSNYGLMRIDFNEPYSIRELVNSYNKIAREDGSSKIYKPASKTLQHSQSTSSLYGTDVVCEEHRNLIESISRQVVFDCAAATSVMSTNALAFLLLTRFRKGGQEQLIAAALDDLRNSLSGCKDLGFSGESSHIVAYACDLLGSGLVTRTRDDNGRVLIRPVPTVESFIELGYYSNMLTPHFAQSSILMTTFHALLPSVTDQQSSTGVSRKKLVDTALENCLVYRYEFILNKPTQVLESMLQKQLDDLLICGFLRTNESNVLSDQRDAQRIAQSLALDLGENDDEDFQHVDKWIEEPNDLIFPVMETLEQQRYMCEVLAPFASTYVAVAQALQIIHRSSMLESEFINFVINDISNKVKNGSCAYAESISTDSVRNCLKLLEKWSVIEVCNQRGMRLISLNTLYEMSRDSLNTIVKKIEALMPTFNTGHFRQQMFHDLSA